PSFAAATVGQRFVADSSIARDGSDRIAEVPDTLRHSVTVKLKVEQYHPLTQDNHGLSYIYPLTKTFKTVELVGRPVSLGHLVDSNVQGGLYYSAQHTYTPYFAHGDEVITGTAYQELITNFPLGSQRLTGAWLLLEVSDANGTVEKYEREIVDRIGFEGRQPGGTIQIGGGGNGTAPLVNTQDVFTVFATSSKIPPSVMQQFGKHAMDRMQQLKITNAAELDELGRIQNPSAAQKRRMQEIQAGLNEAMTAMNATIGAMFMTYSGVMNESLARGMVTRAYADSTDVYIVSSQIDATNQNDPKLNMNLDLQRVAGRVIAAPGQAANAEKGYLTWSGYYNSWVEGGVLSTLTNQVAVSTWLIFAVANEQNVPLEILSLKMIDKLAPLNLSVEAKARITADLKAGYIVIVPQRMITIDGTTTVGWWRIDPETGRMTDVMENGLHVAYIEVAFLWYYASFMSGYVSGFAYAVLLKMYANVMFRGFLGLDLTPEEAKDLLLSGLKSAPAMKYVSLAQEISTLHGLFFSTIPTILKLEAHLGDFVVDKLLGLEIGIKLGYQTAFRLGIDPPLPDVLVSGVEPPSAQTRDQALLRPTPTYSSSRVSVDGTTDWASLSDITGAAWQSTAATGLRYTELSSRAAQLRDASTGALIATGAVTTKAESGGIATVEGSIEYRVTGRSQSSFYAPALPELAAGGAWQSYDAALSADAPYTIDLRDAVVTVNSTDVYTGSFELTTADATSVRGLGLTAQPNLAPAVALRTQEANLMAGPITGTLTVGETSVDASSSWAIAEYTGPLTVTAETATTDRIALAGDADFFTLRTSPTTSTTNPTTAVTFRAEIGTNATDAYTTTVEAPAGWNVDLDAAGLIKATPPEGTEPGAYTILVTAQSSAHPDLFATTVHTVTTTVHQGLELSLDPDALITVPYGTANPDVLSGDINNGQAQVPGAAYTATITNTSTSAHTFSVSVAGLPDGWLILSGAEGRTATSVTLPPGGVGQIGLYVKPTTGTLPTPGTSYGITVTATATDSPSLTQTANRTFTMPSLAFSQVSATPDLVYSTPGLTTTFDLNLRNVGNAIGSFPILTELPQTLWTTNAPTMLTVGAGQSVTETVTLSTPDGQVGREYRVAVLAPSGVYTPTTTFLVRMVSPQALAAHETAEIARQLPDSELGSALDHLGNVIEDLEADMLDRPTRDRVVVSIGTVGEQLEPYPALPAADALPTIGQALSGHTSETDIAADLVDLREALHDLQEQLAIIAQYGLAAQITPGAA
ncbi:MAG TPA: FixG Ig-like domain-containing protein, partial [Herpetosiphonaceae bacterium]